jgi:subtilisin-like proprotein convertase family protein
LLLQVEKHARKAFKLPNQYLFALDCVGNDRTLGVDSNADGYLNSRFTICVGAVGKDSVAASYSTTGANVFVSAPGGDDEFISNNIVAKPGGKSVLFVFTEEARLTISFVPYASLLARCYLGGCHDATVGTSFAAPVVSGVIALMLEARPDLGWRDVQALLASTSQRVQPDDSSWTTNSAGFNHSYKYGFGLVDAYAAVTASKTWRNLGPEVQLEGNSGLLNAAIPDSPLGTIVTNMTLSPAPGVTGTFIVESVVLYIDIAHQSRGDLLITLISPSGTPSIMAPSPRRENQQLTGDERWKLLTLRAYGESPFGQWSLQIKDQKQGRISDCVDDLNWQITSGVLGDLSCLGKSRQWPVQMS